MPVITFLLQLVVDLLEDGRELLARSAPAGAEVHGQHFPVQSLRADLAAVRLTKSPNTKIAAAAAAAAKHIKTPQKYVGDRVEMSEGR